MKLYENLEAETIKASVHRHKLAPFAEEIENEIRGFVMLFSVFIILFIQRDFASSRPKTDSFCPHNTGF